MRRFILVSAVFLSFWPFFGKAETNVDVKVNTPGGSIEVKKDPPSEKVIVVPAQPTIVVDKQTPAPPPSGGCGCR